jgi:hypothetical protein
VKTGEVEVRKLAVWLRSNLHRSVDRATRKGRREDPDIMRAWIRRAASRRGDLAVDEPTWEYEADWIGPGARQYATLRVVTPKDDLERRIFRDLRVAPGVTWVRYPIIEPVQVERGNGAPSVTDVVESRRNFADQ